MSTNKGIAKYRKACGALAVLAIAVAFAVGCGSGSGGTTSTTSPATTTTTQSATTQAPAAPAPKPSVQSFSGNGARTYNAINVPTDSTLKWTDSGESGFYLFQIVSTGEGLNSLLISGDRASGESDLRAQIYHDVRVDAAGDWTFQIVPK